MYNTDDAAKLLTHGIANWKIEGKTKGSPPERQVFMQHGVAAGGKTTGEVLPARVVDFRPLSQGDVALLKVEATDLPAVELAPGSDVAIGTRVLSIGYPGSTDQVTDKSFEPTNKDGQISAKKTQDSVPVYETSAALSGGMSGGPTVNVEGRVVGLVIFKINGEEQAFNYLAPSSNLAELLTRNGVKPELGNIDQKFRKGLADYYAGHYTTAIASFEKVLALSPTHEQAQEYKTRAAKDREQYGDAADGSGGAIILVLFLLFGFLFVVAVAVVVLVLVLRGRKRRQAGTPLSAPHSGMPMTQTSGLQNTPGMPGNSQGEAWAPQTTAPPAESPAAAPAPGSAPGSAPVSAPDSAPVDAFAPPATPTVAAPSAEDPTRTARVGPRRGRTPSSGSEVLRQLRGRENARQPVLPAVRREPVLTASAT